MEKINKGEYECTHQTSQYPLIRFSDILFANVTFRPDDGATGKGHEVTNVN